MTQRTGSPQVTAHWGLFLFWRNSSGPQGLLSATVQSLPLPLTDV